VTIGQNDHTDSSSRIILTCGFVQYHLWINSIIEAMTQHTSKLPTSWVGRATLQRTCGIRTSMTWEW
jgi:hypothetical protein